MTKMKNCFVNSPQTSMLMNLPTSKSETTHNNLTRGIMAGKQRDDKIT